MCCLHPHTKQNNQIIVQTFRCAVALLKSWVCKYSIRFQVMNHMNLKLLCETLKNEKWKILAWYLNKMRGYRQRNPKWGDWRWTNFQMQWTGYFWNQSYMLFWYAFFAKLETGFREIIHYWQIHEIICLNERILSSYTLFIGLFFVLA